MRIKSELFGNYVVDVMFNGFQIKSKASKGDGYTPYLGVMSGEQQLIGQLAQTLLMEEDGDVSPQAFHMKKENLIKSLVAVFSGESDPMERIIEDEEEVEGQSDRNSMSIVPDDVVEEINEGDSKN